MSILGREHERGFLQGVAGDFVAFVAGSVLRGGGQGGAAEGPVGGSRLRWFDVAALCLAHAVIALLGWAAIAALLGESFRTALDAG